MTDKALIAKLRHAIKENARYEAELVNAMIEKFGHEAYEVYCEVTSKKGADFDGSDPIYGLDDE